MKAALIDISLMVLGLAMILAMGVIGEAAFCARAYFAKWRVKFEQEKRVLDGD